jgi:hypothetical protein
MEQMEVVLAKIKTKALYRLQIIVSKELQSRARLNAKNLETSKVDKEVLETILKEVQIKCEGEKQRVEKLDQRL